MYKSVEEIKANVKLNWNHHNCKFRPGSRVIVNGSVKDNSFSFTDKEGNYERVHVHKSYYSKPIQNRCGAEGNVVAVSCTPDGLIRGYSNGSSRMYTRYYVQFNDGSIFGIHSHSLDRARVPVYDKVKA